MRQNLLKSIVLSSIALLIVSGFTLHITVSANKAAQEIELVNQNLHSDSDFELQDERTKQIIQSPVFADFNRWIEQYQSGNFRGNEIEENKRGETLAATRRELFKELIKIAPKTALEYAVSDETKNHLPASIAENLERRVSAYGDLLVYGVDKIDPLTGKMLGGNQEHEVVMGEARFKAFVYGRRESMTTKLQIPLQGVVLDGLMAVDESPARNIKPSEYESRGVDSSRFGEHGIVAEVGGNIVYYSDQSELKNFVREQIEWEGKIGPVRPNESPASGKPNSSWTEGPKTILFIRVDFSDKPGEPLDVIGQPLTVQRSQDLMNEANSFFINNSYGKTSIQSVTVTPVIRLPQPSTYYMGAENYVNFTGMMADARNAARVAGFETNSYNLDIVASSNPPLNTAGFGSLGAKGNWLLGVFRIDVLAHELGHNYGLSHANLWRTTDGSVIGQGNNLEYGDPFDMMGCCDRDINAHFSAYYKRSLNWLTDANVQTVTDNGTYRIFAQDSPTLNGIKTLRIRKDAAKTYWIDFRQIITSTSNVMDGAIVRWDSSGGAYYGVTQLLDMTPNTSTNIEYDAPLLIGKSFYDPENRIRITVLGKGNTTPESLDVKVELNTGCTFSLGQSNVIFSSSGGQGNVSVNTQSGCSLIVTSNNDWLQFIPANLTDLPGVSFRVAVNNGSQPRTGSLNISGQTFTIQQNPASAGCTFSLGQSNVLFSSSGGLDSVSVNTQGGCSPNSVSNNDWLQIISTNTSPVRYVTAANYASQPRTGTLNISGQIFTVQQNAAITACAAQPAGLVAWWRGEGNGLDQTGVNNGVLNSSLGFANGKVGGGFARVGQSFLRVPNSPALALERSMTFEGWIKLDNYFGVIIERSQGGTGFPFLRSYQFNVNLDGLLEFNIFDNSNSSVSIHSQNVLPKGQFIHVAASLDDATGQIKLYINGSLVAQEVTAHRPSSLNPSANPANTIGGLTGVSDEISVYNRALYASEIQAIYNAGIAATGAAGKCLSAPSPRTQFDFDGDGKSDVSVFRPDSGIWYLNNSATGFSGAQFGINGDKIVPADYDGDGKTDIAVYRSGTWYLQRSQLGFSGISFGDANDIPVPADYDGDGKTDISVFRPSNGTWYSLNLVSSQVTTISFGVNGDKPVPADYDGDGKADIAVFRPSNNTWYTSTNPANNYGAIIFGDANDKLVPADYDGDGKADVAVYRPSNGSWYLRQSTAGLTGITFGLSTDLPVPADYDGDGRADVAVFRNGTWYIERSAYGFTGLSFGANSDKPIPSAFIQ